MHDKINTAYSMLGIIKRNFKYRPERGPEIPEILKSVLKCPEIH